MTGVDDLSPVAQDYLKVIWSAREWGAPPITTKGLAERMGTSQANVSDAMRRLQAQGLLSYQPYRPVSLTREGEQLAVAMVRRHRLLETFLARVLGYGWEDVHEDAERLEHAVSDRMLARIDALLGHPRIDPHGDPIPSADGHWPGQGDTIRLDEAVPGRYEVVRVDDSDPARLADLRRIGLIPGARVDIDRADPVRVVRDERPLDLDAATFRQVRVRHVD
ncbi:metal-dependent transcriptional regulator [Propionicimonas sp.]|uniref:metal-dependent transcriptional regulator n=1 Tax=Propionicimonas sp. TaxID=1955623 RepID=UPI0039E30B5A